MILVLAAVRSGVETLDKVTLADKTYARCQVRLVPSTRVGHVVGQYRSADRYSGYTRSATCTKYSNYRDLVS